MVIIIFLRMTKRKNNTNNKEEGCAKEDLQLSRFSNFSFTFHQPSFLSSFLLLLFSFSFIFIVVVVVACVFSMNTLLYPVPLKS